MVVHDALREGVMRRMLVWLGLCGALAGVPAGLAAAQPVPAAFVMVVSDNPDNLNPYLHSLLDSEQVYRFVFDSLYRVELSGRVGACAGGRRTRQPGRADLDLSSPAGRALVGRTAVHLRRRHVHMAAGDQQRRAHQLRDRVRQDRARRRAVARDGRVPSEGTVRAVSGAGRGRADRPAARLRRAHRRPDQPCPVQPEADRHGPVRRCRSSRPTTT